MQISYRQSAESAWKPGLLRDLSTAGAGLRIPLEDQAEIKVGDSIEIELRLPGTPEPLHLACIVRSLRSEKRELICGVEFDKPRSERIEEQRARLAEFLSPLREAGSGSAGVELDEEQLERLATQLLGIKQALRTVAKGMKSLERGSPRLRVACSQIEWAASHLQEAVRELEAQDLLLGEGRENRATTRSTLPAAEGLKGHSHAVGIPEVLGFLASLEKSGTLRIHTREENYLIQLEQGAVVYTQGDDPPVGERLGEILLAQGAVEDTDLERAMALAPDEQVIGHTFLREGVVDEAQLRQALTHQVQLLFRRIFAARDVSYQFDEGVRIVPPDDIQLNVTSLLLESARLSDEADRGVEEDREHELEGEARTA